ncbi:MAG: M23 family metallopeptidase, partial [bacterium]|nr:M23 family metallopeptidase [bacterium]
MKWKTGIAILFSLTYLVAIIGCAHTPTRKAANTKRPKPFVVKSTQQVSKYGFIWPVEGEVLSFFGERSGWIHQGVDIAAKKSTKIHAAMSGKVIYSDNKISGYGNMIIIEHKKGYSTVYAHNAKNLVKKGKRVNRGQVIALVGMTGNATGPHLHFEIRKG